MDISHVHSHHNHYTPPSPSPLPLPSPFSTQGDTLENVAQELGCIIETGYYTFQCGEEKGGEFQRFLEYDIHASPSSSEHEQEGQSGGNLHQVKNSEQVRDFLTKLGFLNRDDKAERVKDFLHLSQVSHSSQACMLYLPEILLLLSQSASKLFELYLKLHELGYPEYLTADKIPMITCSHTKESMEREVQETQLLITEWNGKVSNLRAKYTWLLYFSVPKMMLLYDLIHSSCQGEERTDEIVHEVSFLMTNQLEDTVKLRRGREVKVYTRGNHALHYTNSLLPTPN